MATEMTEDQKTLLRLSREMRDAYECFALAASYGERKSYELRAANYPDPTPRIRTPQMIAQPAKDLHDEAAARFYAELDRQSIARAAVDLAASVARGEPDDSSGPIY